MNTSSYPEAALVRGKNFRIGFGKPKPTLSGHCATVKHTFRGTTVVPVARPQTVEKRCVCVCVGSLGGFSYQPLSLLTGGLFIQVDGCVRPGARISQVHCGKGQY